MDCLHDLSQRVTKNIPADNVQQACDAVCPWSCREVGVRDGFFDFIFSNGGAELGIVSFSKDFFNLIKKCILSSLIQLNWLLKQLTKRIFE